MEAIMYFVQYETVQHYFVVPEHHYKKNSYTCTTIGTTTGTTSEFGQSEVSSAQTVTCRELFIYIINQNSVIKLSNR